MATLKEICTRLEPDIQSLDLRDYGHFANSELLKILKCLPPLGERGPWVAGGSVWRTVNNEPLTNCDVDIFFSSKKHYEEGCRSMLSYPYVNNILKENKNKWNTTYTIHVNDGKFNKIIDVQFIGTFIHKSLGNLLQSFDFSVCQFGYDGNILKAGPRSIEDLQQRKIRILNLAHPKTFLKHLLKYLNNGFTISSDETKAASRIMLDLNMWSKSASSSVDYNEDEGEDRQAEPATGRGQWAPAATMTWDDAMTRQQPTRQARPRRTATPRNAEEALRMLREDEIINVNPMPPRPEAAAPDPIQDVQRPEPPADTGVRPDAPTIEIRQVRDITRQEPDVFNNLARELDIVERREGIQINELPVPGPDALDEIVHELEQEVRRGNEQNRNMPDPYNGAFARLYQRETMYQTMRGAAQNLTNEDEYRRLRQQTEAWINNTNTR